MQVYNGKLSLQRCLSRFLEEEQQGYQSSIVKDQPNTTLVQECLKLADLTICQQQQFENPVDTKCMAMNTMHDHEMKRFEKIFQVIDHAARDVNATYSTG